LALAKDAVNFFCVAGKNVGRRYFRIKREPVVIQYQTACFFGRWNPLNRLLAIGNRLPLAARPFVDADRNFRVLRSRYTNCKWSIVKLVESRCVELCLLNRLAKLLLVSLRFNYKKGSE
jgi:hypothetical protein